jgi:hypothetical protein
MSEPRRKSTSEKKIEESLGISMNDLNSQLNDVTIDKQSDPDAEKLKRIKEREELKKELEKAQNAMESYDDSSFVKIQIRNMILRASNTLQLMESELMLDPSPRMAETYSQLLNAVTTTIQGLYKTIEHEDKVRQNQEVIELKTKAANKNINNTTNTFVIQGNFSDMLKQIKSEPAVKTIEVVKENVNGST